MKNKLLIVALLFSILLSGCGTSGDSSPAVVDNTDTWEDDSEYENTELDDMEDELLDETQETEPLMAYELENTCTGISDAGSGYKAEYTISVTNWIRASNPETLQDIWKSIGGKNDLPGISSFHELSNDGFTNENAAVAFGTISFCNITDGFDFTEDNPRTFHCRLDAHDIYMKGHYVEGYIEYSNNYEYFSLWESGMSSVLSANMTHNSWGPVPLMLVCSNAFTPENPNGDEVLNDCKIYCGYPATDDLTLMLEPDMVESDSSADATSADETFDDNSYIVPASYDITGKWKSVGDSGFGQAQPRAIVVFDGNNCNFYSPKDTYAFYKEDDRYVLDITSVLGESLSQSVNIIDDDNIEVAGASLMRIE